jgi:hypothetical protein
MPLALGAFPVPGSIFRLRTTFVDFLQSFDCHIEIPHNAEMGVQPLQLFRYSRLLRTPHHGREEGDSRPQPREREAHLMQGFGIASTGRLMMSRQIPEVVARDNPKCSIARHLGIERRRRVVPPRLRSPGVSGALRWWFR